MDRTKKIAVPTIDRITEVMVFMALFALPWINKFHVSTFLFMTLAVLLLSQRIRKMDLSWFLKQWVFILFILYYILQVTSLCIFHDHWNKAAIAQKASLIAIPFLFYMVCVPHKGFWKTAIRGFVLGNVFAAVFCIIYAIFRYISTGYSGVFFYHAYAGITGMNAIYFSLYILVSLIYLLKYPSEAIVPGSRSRWAVPLITGFLLFNLLLLSSKMMIAIGVIILLLTIRDRLKNAIQKTMALLLFILIGISLAIIKNPVSRRFYDINLTDYGQVFQQDKFADFHFDGLNLRLLLWRFGMELSQINFGWLVGQGGGHYHDALNEKIKQSQMYTGDITSHTTGYLNYNMHNQYMESYVQFGAVGFMILVMIIAGLIYFSFSQPTVLLRYFVLIFAALFFSESVLETQSGILVFTIIISGEWIQLQQQRMKLNFTV